MKQKKFSFWKNMYPYMKEYRGKIIFSIIMYSLIGVCMALQPFVIKFIVDDGLSNDALKATEKLIFVAMLCGFYMFLSVTRMWLGRLGIKRMSDSVEGTIYNLRTHFFKHVQYLCMRFYSKTSAGELFNCIMGSPIINIKTYLVNMFLTVPYQAVTLVISIAALFKFDWMLTLVLILTAISMALVNYYSRKKMRMVASEYIRTEADTSKYINDTLHGIEAIKLYSIEADMLRSFKRFTNQMYKKGVAVTLSQNLEGLKPEFLRYVGTVVVYLVGAYSCIYRGMSVGTLYAFISSKDAILNILTAWLNMGLQKSSAESGLEKIVDVLNENTTTPEKVSQRDINIERESAKSKDKPCIEFDNVSFAYDNKYIFKNFNCTIKQGESVALVGTSGSGKSTLTKLAMRLYDATEGSVKVYGRDVKDYDIHDLRVSFGVVPQDPFLFYGSIWDNVKIANPKASNKEIIDAMEMARMHEFVNEMENGWNTVVGDGGARLSGGQIQRVAIARAILGNPEILIFDEATSALDNISEKHIQQAMEDLMKTHTVLIVAHRLSTIRNVDRIMVFDEGKVVEEGTYDELEVKGGVFTKLLNS